MISDRINEYCSNAGITISRFEKLCGIGNGSVGKWKKHDSMPSLSTLYKIERATGIPAYMWIEGSVI